MRSVVRAGLALLAVALLAPMAAYATVAPEIDPSTGMASIVLLAGSFTLIRWWRRR